MLAARAVLRRGNALLIVLASKPCGRLLALPLEVRSLISIKRRRVVVVVVSHADSLLAVDVRHRLAWGGSDSVGDSRAALCSEVLLSRAKIALERFQRIFVRVSESFDFALNHLNLGFVRLFLLLELCLQLHLVQLGLRIEFAYLSF